MIKSRVLVSSVVAFGLIGLAGCGQQKSSVASPSTSTATKTSAASTNTAKAFNPDNVKDKLSYDQIQSKFGDVPSFKGKNIKIGDVEKTMTNEYWQALADGYKNAAQKFGVTVSVQAAQGESDQTGQLQIAETMLQQNYSALLASPISDANLNPASTLAKQKKIPIINVDDALMSDADVFVGNDQKDNGVNAANWIADKIGKQGSVAVVEGQAGVYAARERTAGFKETISKYSNIKLVADVPADWDRQKALDVATNIIQQNPAIKAIYCNNDTMALGVVQAVKNANKLGKIIVIGTDGTNAALESIKNGELTGTVDSFPEKTGEIGLEVALRELAGQKLPRVITTPQALVTKDNMSQYIK
jgi:ribose transport system substrate-binding protein